MAEAQSSTRFAFASRRPAMCLRARPCQAPAAWRGSRVACTAGPLLPASYQQTVAQPFTRVGVGLHTGVTVSVRVRPAPAGIGRYFVRVPDGTIPAEDEPAPAGECAESPYAPPRGEARILASLASVLRPAAGNLCTILGDGPGAVMTVEHLLSALEACGVDNARVEISGGGEMPLLDGSAAPWVESLRRVRLAPAPGGAPRLAWRPTEPLTVREGDAFAAVFPSRATRLTYGIDFTAKSAAIGKQWVTWSPSEDGPYETDIASARTFTTLADATVARERGLIKGGSAACALVADGEAYTNPPLRYDPDECARHKMLDLIGDLALLGDGGNAGLPLGHVIAYKAGHDLHLRLARAIADAARVGGWARVPAEVISSPKPVAAR